MNVNKIALVAITFFSLLSFGQTAKIIYILENPSFKDNPSERKQKLLDEIELMSFKLLYNSDKSYFTKEKNIPIDSYYANIALIFANSLDPSHQFLKSRSSFINKEISNQIYQVDFSDRMNNWELKSESKQIESYKCYKATMQEKFDDKTREVVAWYTPEIPVPYGPAGYGGLPGLILQLDFAQNVFIANKIILNPKKDFEITELKEGKIITEREKTLLMRKARKVTPD